MRVQSCRSGRIRDCPIGIGAPHDAIRAHVLNNAAVDLARGSGVLDEVRGPLAVRLRGHEVPMQRVVVHRQVRLFALVVPIHAAGPQSLLGIPSRLALFSDLNSGPLELIAQGPASAR